MATCTIVTRKGLEVITETMPSAIAEMINQNFYVIGDHLTNTSNPHGVLASDLVLNTDHLQVNGTPALDLSDNINSITHMANGVVLEDHTITITESGGTVSLNLEKNGGGNLTIVFSDTFNTFTAASVALTAGSDVSPQLNYVFIPQSTKVLTVSTSSFPATEHVPIATVLLQSAASVATDGSYKVHAWTDHLIASNNQGHISHLNRWIRGQHASYLSGVGQTLTITPNGGAPDAVVFTTAAGVILQLHEHIFPAFTGTPDLYVVNDSVTAYDKITDLNALLFDSTGASISGKYFSLVIWGVVSEDETDCKLFVNLPGGSYNTAAGVVADDQAFANYAIPAEFRGTGFLISEFKLRHQPASSGTWTSQEEIDLRGLFPGISAGAGSIVSSEFSDNVFRIQDNSDPTKEIALEASSISTGTTRTITMPDEDVTLVAGLSNDNIKMVFDGEGVALTTGLKGFIQIPFACTITVATLLADQSGDLVVDVWKDTYANHPPTNADSITASAKPTISSAIKSTDNTLTGWTTAIVAGDILAFNVDSVTTITLATLILEVTR